jgi:hypothetical protein
MPAFTAGIVLLLNIWGGKRSGLYTDPQKEMADVHKCMAMLKSCEKRSVDFFFTAEECFSSIHSWHSAGRLWYVHSNFELFCLVKGSSYVEGTFCTNWHLLAIFRCPSLVLLAERSVNVIQIVQYLLRLRLHRQRYLAPSQDRAASGAKQLPTIARSL